MLSYESEPKFWAAEFLAILSFWTMLWIVYLVDCVSKQFFVYFMFSKLPSHYFFDKFKTLIESNGS